MTQHRNFIKFFSGFSILYLFVVFLINWEIDPYGIRKSGGRVANDRLIKAVKVIQKRPKTIFLGSSGVARGLDPSHAVFSGKEPVYNLSLLGANIYELKRYFEHAESNNKLQVVIIGLDFYAFNRFREVRNGFSEKRLGIQYILPSDFFGLYLSLDSLNLALNSNERGLYFAKDGTYQHPINEEIKHYFEVKLIEDFTQEEEMYWNYQFSAETIHHFKDIVQAADKNGIELKIFLPPLHATLFYSAMISNYWPSYEAWLKEIVAIHPVWDFSGCNSVTTEPIKNSMNWFEDPSHYTKPTGDWIFERVFDFRDEGVASDFGIYVNPSNVDEHLRKTKMQCQQWRENNPEIIRWLKELNLGSKMTLSSGN